METEFSASTPLFLDKVNELEEWLTSNKSYLTVIFVLFPISGIKVGNFYLKKETWPWNNLDGYLHYKINNIIDDENKSNHWIPHEKLLNEWRCCCKNFKRDENLIKFKLPFSKFQ